MTSLLDIRLEATSVEYLTAVALSNRKAQDVVDRLRSNPGLMITLAVPTETAQVRAHDLVGHLPLDFGVAFATDGTMLIRLRNGACFDVVVDVNLQRNGPHDAATALRQAPRMELDYDLGA